MGSKEHGSGMCRSSKENMENYGIHLLVLSHVYSMPQLKQRCIISLVQLMTIKNVVDACVTFFL